MEDNMPKIPRLIRRGTRYYYRAKIPADLIKFYDGKREIKQSLRTSNYTDAIVQVRRLTVQHDEEFAMHRKFANVRWRTITHIDQSFIDEFGKALEYAVLLDDLKMRQSTTPIYPLEDWMEAKRLRLAKLKKAQSIQNPATIYVELDQCLHELRIKLDVPSSDYEHLALAYLRLAVLIEEKIDARSRGDIVDTPSNPFLGEGLPQIAPPPESGRHLKWERLFQLWLDNDIDRPENTIGAYRAAFNELKNVAKLKNPEQLSRNEIEHYRDFLRHEKGLQPKTITKKLGFIKSILQVAVDSEKLPHNPAQRIKVVGVKKKSSRKAYDQDDMLKIFSSPVYQEQERPYAGGGEAAYWLPLLAYYSGARLEELAQLRPEDVGCEDGIFYLRIMDDREADFPTRLKTVSSERNIPLHTDLLHEHHFLDYVSKQIDNNSGRLFPDLKADRQGKLSGNWSKWWGRYARNVVGITDKNKVFHSFRHTFKNLCVRAGVSREISEQLMGHADDSKSSHSLYGDKIPLRNLNEAIKRIPFKDFVPK